MADSRTANNLASDLDFNCYCHVSGGEHNCLHCRAADRIASLESQLAEANAMLDEAAELAHGLEGYAKYTSWEDDAREWLEKFAKLRGRERADG